MRIPTATYRLQLNHQFRIQDVRSILDYLERLGISDIYASPVFSANPKSMHGYDMTDPSQLNTELGTQAEFEQLLKDVRCRDMGWLQDFVPNHMAYSRFNPWLMDVLEYGQASPYYHFFDILWDHPDETLYGRVLAPFLGETLESVIDSGLLKLDFDPDGFFVEYYEHRFPINLISVAQLSKTRQAKTLTAYLPEEEENRRSIQQKKNGLYQRYQQSGEMHDAIQSILESIRSEPARFKHLMDNQYYHLAHWKTASKTINYRRFFYINDLICLNIDRPEVFEAVHAALAQWVKEGRITGLRIDHLDGLKYPERYLRDLRERFGDVYIVAEKILEKDESVPRRWPLEGTTGYDFANFTTAVFCDNRNREAFIKGYCHFIGTKLNYTSLLFEQKTKVIMQHMSGDIDNLVRFLEQTDWYSDQPKGTDELAGALITLIAAFGIYRTYCADHSDNHRAYLQNAVKKAKNRAPELSEHLDRIASIFLSHEKTPKDEEFIARFRQITGPAMAKGFEDTLLYQYVPLVSLNEVGSMPETFGVTVDQFHEFNQMRLQTPHTMNATSTHDTKRGEDVRARINVLSEMPRDWFDKVRSWHRMNRHHKVNVDGEQAPDQNDEYMLYQVMLGALPTQAGEHDSFCERLKAYLLKSLREAKVHSNWIQPNESYEQAAVEFLEKIFQRPREDRFRSDFLAFWRLIHQYGLVNSCSQALLKMTCPGIPDFYQGTECGDFNLVDPDNRRPVDYTEHIGYLDQLADQLNNNRSAVSDWVCSHRDSGLMKLFIIHQVLQLRKDNPVLFTEGDYIPLPVRGMYQDHVIAFARFRQGRFILTVVPRLISRFVEPGQMPVGHAIWRDTRISLPNSLQGQGMEIFSQNQMNLQDDILLGDVLDKFPVSLICDSL